MHYSWTVFALITVIMAGATAIQGFAGFGAALVAVPLLAFVDPGLIPGPLISATLVFNLLVAYRERTELDFSGLKIALGGQIAGTIGASLVINLIPEDKFSLVFGIIVLLGVLISLLGIKFKPVIWALITAGSLAGFMGTISSINGPPMALVYQNAKSARLRSTLAGFFIIASILSIIGLTFVGRYGFSELKMAGMMLPGTILGFTISSLLIRKIDQSYTKFTRLAVLTFSTISALIVILRNLP